MLFGSSAAQLTHGWVFIQCAERRKHANYSFPEAGVYAFIQRLQQTSLSLCSVDSPGLLFSVRTLQCERVPVGVCVCTQDWRGGIFGSPYESGSDVAPDEICLARHHRGRAVLLRGLLPASQCLRQLVSMAKNRLPLLSLCALSLTSHLPFWLNSAEKWCFIFTLPAALSPLSLWGRGRTSCFGQVRRQIFLNAKNECVKLCSWQRWLSICFVLAAVVMSFILNQTSVLRIHGGIVKKGNTVKSGSRAFL